MRTLRIREFAGLLEKFYERVDKEIERFNGKIVCKQGCSYCCYNTECYALPVESAYVALFLNENFTSEFRKNLAEKIENFRANYHKHVARGTIEVDPSDFCKISSKARAMGILCPFLSERDECFIYSVRPLTCRTCVNHIQEKDFLKWLNSMHRELESINRLMLFTMEVRDRIRYVSPLPLMLKLKGDVFVTGIAEDKVFQIRR